MATKREAECCYVDSQDWLENTPVKEGSWWSEWQAWLATHSSGKVKPPRLGTLSKGFGVIGDAPGAYVRQPDGRRQ